MISKITIFLYINILENIYMFTENKNLSLVLLEFVEILIMYYIKWSNSKTSFLTWEKYNLTIFLRIFLWEI